MRGCFLSEQDYQSIKAELADKRGITNPSLRGILSPLDTLVEVTKIINNKIMLKNIDSKEEKPETKNPGQVIRICI